MARYVRWFLPRAGRSVEANHSTFSTQKRPTVIIFSHVFCHTSLAGRHLPNHAELHQLLNRAEMQYYLPQLPDRRKTFVHVVRQSPMHGQCGGNQGSRNNIVPKDATCGTVTGVCTSPFLLFILCALSLSHTHTHTHTHTHSLSLSLSLARAHSRSLCVR